jgi:Protein of unknown function (DUF3489)
MSIKLTDTQLVLLGAAAQRKDLCLVAQPTLKGATAQKVASKLISAGFVKEVKAKASDPIWRRDEKSGASYALKLTAAGAKVIAVDNTAEPENAGEESAAQPGAPIWRRDDAGQGYALKLTGAGLKAIAVDEGSQDTIEPGEAPQPQAKNGARPDEVGQLVQVATPRDGSKLALVIELLRRADGATIVVLTQATGWLPHTTRAALTGLRKRGYAVIRQRLGAGNSVYRISDGPAHVGDLAVRQRDAIDGRGPKRKATQAA